MPKTETKPQAGVPTTPEGAADKNAQLMERIKQLEDESAKYRMQNTILESKLRGYQTLGQILQDTKRELRKYKTQECPSPPAVEKENEKSEVKSQNVMNTSVDSNDLYDAKNTPPQAGSMASSASRPEEGTDKQTPRGQPSNEQHVTNANSTEEKLSITSQPAEDTAADKTSGGKSDAACSNSDTVKAEDIKKPGTHVNDPSAACLPVFEDTWEMSVESSVLENISMHSSDLTGSEASTAGSLSLPPFRSSSGSSIQIVSPPDSETQLPGGNQDNQGVDEEVNLSVQVEDLSKVLCGSVGMNSTSDLAPRLTRISLDVLRMEKQLTTSQMISELMAENEKLKLKVHISLPDKDRHIMELRSENDMLLKKVCKLERERDRMPPLHDAPSAEWVQVNMQQQSAPSEPQQEYSLQKKFQTAQEELEQLTKKKKVPTATLR